MLTLEEKTFIAQLLARLSELSNAIKSNTEEIKKLNENLNKHSSTDN